MVEDDLKAISFPVNYELVKKSPAIEFKNLIKKKFKTAAFEHLVKLKQNHSKVRQINHSELKTQEYLLSHVFSNKDAEMIFSLRTKTNKQYKANFPSMNQRNMSCPLLCWEPHETPPLDSQEHLLECRKLKTTEINYDSNYAKLFGNTENQKEILDSFKSLLGSREVMIAATFLPEEPLDPSTVQDLCCDITVSTSNVSTVVSCGINK